MALEWKEPCKHSPISAAMRGPSVDPLWAIKIHEEKVHPYWLTDKNTLSHINNAVKKASITAKFQKPKMVP